MYSELQKLFFCAHRDQDSQCMRSVRTYNFAQRLGERIVWRTGYVRASAFLKWSLDIAMIQPSNAAAVVGTLAEGNASKNLL